MHNGEALLRSDAAARPPVVVQVEIDEIDMLTAGDLEDLLTSVPDGALVVADLDRVRFMSSTGLSALIRAWKRARARGGDLAVAGGADTVRRLLSLSGVDRAIGCYPSVGQAADALSGAASAGAG